MPAQHRCLNTSQLRSGHKQHYNDVCLDYSSVAYDSFNPIQLDSIIFMDSKLYRTVDQYTEAVA